MTDRFKRVSWQNARTILPMGLSHNFGMSINLMSFMGMLSRRLAFCEQHETVGIAWALRKKIEEKFPLIASYLKPACDYAKKCLYNRSYGLSNLFGVLFKSCGRWPVEDSLNELAEFNESSADMVEIEKELGFHIPQPNEYPEYLKFEDLKESDKKLFSSA